TDALEEREVGAKRKGYQCHHDQEEQDAHQCAAADAHGDSHVADEDGGQRSHADISIAALGAAAPSRFSSCAPSSCSGPCVAARMMPPPGKCAVLISPAR